MTTLETSAGVQTSIPIAELHLADDNVRRQLGDVDELAASIKTAGLLEPLVVTPRAGGGYLVVCGARRLAAAAKAGLEQLPATVREFSEAERVEAMTIENLQRENLTVLEEAAAYRRLTDELGLSQRELAKRVGRTQGHVSKRLALLELPDLVRAQVDSGGITLEEAQEFGKLSSSPRHVKLALQRMKEGWHVSGAVRHALVQLEHDQAVEKATARLKREGVRILSLVKHKLYGTYGPPTGAVAIKKGGGWDALNLDPAKHAKEPCHAAAVHPRDEEIVYLCTDRKRHPKLKTENERGGARSSRPSDNTEHRELEKARKERRSFLTRLVKRKLPKRDVEQLVFDALIRGAHQEVLKIASKALELDVDGTAYGAALRAAAANSDADQQRVELAIAAATHEEFLSPYYGWDDRHDYFAFLEQRGYQISPAERKKIGRKP